MNALNKADFREFLLLTGINESNNNSDTGKELSYASPVCRNIVVHFSASENKKSANDVVTPLINLEEEWILFPRHGSVNNLGIIPFNHQGEAIRYCTNERNAFTRYLCSRSMEIGSSSTDVYIISGSGNILVTWDHHTLDEGLDIQLREISDASRLLTALNELGTELELYSRED